eukprot:gene2739-957_t
MHSAVVAFVYFAFFGSAVSFKTAFYKPEPGLLLDTWIDSSSKSLENFESISGYPGCPTGMRNLANFEWGVASASKYHHFRFRAYFVSHLSGTHRLIVACKKECQVDFVLQPGVVETVNHTDTTSTTIGWSQSKLSNGLPLIKGFRYKIDARYSGGSSFPRFMKLGILLPNGTEIKPLERRYLRRSIEFYKMDGLLGEMFENTTWPKSLTIQSFADANPTKYPNNPSRYFCRSTIYDTKYDNYPDSFGARYTGYYSMPQNGSYRWYQSCDSFCEVNLTMANNSIAKIYDSAYQSNAEVSIGEYVEKRYYPIDIVHVEGSGNDFLSMKREKDLSTTWEQDWTGLLTNLLEAETLHNIPSPILSVESSTAVSAQLFAPSVPKGDQWSSSNSYEILYHKKSDPSSKVKVAFSGSLPAKKTLTGLQPYTEYSFYIHYFGFIKSTIEHNIISGRKSVRTYEDVPGDYPPNLTAVKKSPNSVQLTWDALSGDAKKNGNITGYTVKYRIRGSQTWLYVEGTSQNRMFDSLKMYAVYEFSVAASTSKGVGVYSPVVGEMTGEDAQQIVAETPFAFTTNMKFTNMALTKHLSKVADVTSVVECFSMCRLCFQEASGCKCSSMNIKRMKTGARLICEINDGSLETSLNNLVQTQGSQYYEVT